MIEEILAHLYKIEIPLPNSPLKAINSYLVKGSGRNLIIDTGMNREECKRVMQAALEKLGADLGKTDFFITHFHVDHLGLVSSLKADNATVYLGRPDAERFKRIMAGSLWTDMIDFTRMNGFPEVEIQGIFDNHPANRYGFKGDLSFRSLEDGDTLSVGSYRFKCVATPGHTKGHMCLHELDKKIFIAGDHILSDITPNISLRSDAENPLKEYLASLDKVKRLNKIGLVLPGHGKPLKNYKERIDELKDHHEERAEEAISILKKGSKNAYEIASEMKWDIGCDSWDHWPVLQKWFAIGEAIAHLKYLEEKGILRKTIQDRKMIFFLN
jgi:glyoxylase-like metal-dependent hydrolase (beta-lactamase superfamily II)